MTTQSGNILSTRAMLARLTISQWAAKRLDRKVTDEVNRAHGASADAGRYTKSLVAKEALATIAKASEAARATHATRSLPWIDDGARILPAAGYASYCEAMRTHREAFESAVSTFIDAYPSLVEQARKDLNGLFSAEDYPDPGEIARRFSFATRLYPVPSAADWRVDLSDEQAETLRADVEHATKEALQLATRDAWERIADVVGRMAERLAGYKPAKAKGEKSEGVFRDSLVSNVRDLVTLLPVLNISQNPRMAAICERMELDLCEWDADALRDNDNARASTAKAAQAILDEVSSFLA